MFTATQLLHKQESWYICINYYCDDEILLILTVTLHEAMLLALHNYLQFDSNYITSVNSEEIILIPVFSLTFFADFRILCLEVCPAQFNM